MEYEIKLLGNLATLAKVFNNFCKYPPKRTRHYAFNTYYLDADNVFYNSGYSLRHRTGVFEIGKESGTELKALDGAVGQVSARLELGHLGTCPLSNYFALKGRTDYPEDAPKVHRGSLAIDMATSVRRLERRSFIKINNHMVLIEAALDDIAYLKPVGAPDSEDLFNVMLEDYKREDELEFEIKTECDPDMFFQWCRDNVIKDEAVELTTKSKALRARI